MVDGLFFCATVTGRGGGHTPFVQAGAETSVTGVEAGKSDPGSSWEGHSGEWVGAGVKDENAESCGIVHTPHSIGDLPTAPHICCCCQMN